jgi:serine/threonine-protein kinase
MGPNPENDLEREFVGGKEYHSLGDHSRIYRAAPKRTNSGAMAQVVRALDTKLKRVVAIKMDKVGPISHDYSVERESLAHVQTNNHFIVRLYDLVDVNGNVGIVMEHLDPSRAKLLSEYVQPTGETMPMEDFLLIMEQLGQFIDSYAKEGNFHRDLKLSNIFFLPDEVDRYIKVIDLGLSGDVFTDSSTRSKGEVVGTPGYLSPQRWDGEQTRLTDEVYALGMVALLLLVRRGRYFDDSRVQPYYDMAHQKKDLVHDLEQSELINAWGADPVRVARVLERALSPDKKTRYQTGREFYSELSRALLTSESQSPRKLNWKFWKRS